MRYELSFSMEFVGSEVVRVLDIVHPNQTWVKFSNIKFVYGSLNLSSKFVVIFIS
jgi:hypothetical protein